MKMHRLFQALLALILVSCLSGVQGQYSAQASDAAQSIASESQFYQTLSGPAPSTHIGTPQQFNITGNTPSNVYLSIQMQQVPYSQYIASPTYTGTNDLWIKGAQDWTQYAVIPQGATATLLAVSPTGGSGTLNFVDSDGRVTPINPYSTLAA
jgi:hypothetical protein